MIEVLFIVKVDDRYREAFVWLHRDGDPERNRKLRRLNGRIIEEEGPYTDAGDAARAAVALARQHAEEREGRAEGGQ